MAKLTLLEIVQSVLSDIDSDYINSIGDTEESEQVANIARNVYYEFCAAGDWNHLHLTTQLQSLSDTNYPNYLVVPETLIDLDVIKYRIVEGGKEKYREMEYCDPNSFLDMVLQRDTTLTNVVTVLEKKGQVPLPIYNDRNPRYWTTFDDKYIILDAFDVSVETTVNGSKSIVTGTQESSWSTTDTFIPDLPGHLFPAYLSAVTQSASIKQKQSGDIYEEKVGKRAFNRQQKKQALYDRRIKPKYGRR